MESAQVLIDWAKSTASKVPHDDREHRAQVVNCPPLTPGDGLSRQGPGQCTNWLIPGRLLCGEMPTPTETAFQNLASMTHFVDLTDEDVPLQFRAQVEARAHAAGVVPPTFVRHTITEFTSGSADAVLAAVCSVMQALAEDPEATVYLHCRAGHGRTGMVAALIIGLAYPTLSVDEVMAYVQRAHDDRVDSWNNWASPETEPQCEYARETIGSIREQITTTGSTAAPADRATQSVCYWCDPALLAQQAQVEPESQSKLEAEPEPQPEPESKTDGEQDPERTMRAVNLSQRADDGPSGLTLFNIVVARTDTGDEILHEYCAYYVGVRPARVTNLRLEGNTVKWEWDEKSFDLASPGACFERELTIESGRLVWAGDVVRTPKPKRQARPPMAPVEQRLLKRDVCVKDEWKSEHGQERVKVFVSHPPTGSELVWDSDEDGNCWADSQSVRGLRTAQVDGYVRVDFVMETSECGDSHAFDVSKFVKLGAAGIEWAHHSE